MFGGHDDAHDAHTNAGAAAPNDTLTGVDDLATNLSAPVNDDSAQGFMSAPSEPVQTVTPTDDSTTDEPTPPTALDSAGDNEELLDLKQQALQQLSPLVGHLEQSPEEKFRTTMMLIQASDNQALLKEAYTAAQTIPDDKARAQALLDVINEINYFTQPKHKA